jgi:elongation factor P
MKINANELRQGNVLETETGLWAILKANHVSPGKGGAFVQVEMRNLRTGIKRDDKFRSGEQVERVRIDDEEFTFLFGDDTILTFMNPETYDQLGVPMDLLVRRHADQRFPAAAGGAGTGGSRSGGEGANRFLLLQAG